MTAELYNLQEEREARNVRAAEELKKGQSVKQIIHDLTYIPKPLIVAGEAVASLFERLKGIERYEGRGLVVNCISCKNPIERVDRDDLEHLPHYIDEGELGPLHHSCYQKNIVETRQFAETLDRLRDY